jgi:uncharacterized protein (DUF1330 family)
MSRNRIAIAIAVAAGFGMGAFTVDQLQAQGKPPVFVVVEIDVSNPDAYAKEYAPKAQALVRANGARLLAANPSPVVLEGAPAKRVAILQWESMDKVKSWYGSKEFQENRKIGNKYAKFRYIAVEGLPPKP